MQNAVKLTRAIYDLKKWVAENLAAIQATGATSIIGEYSGSGDSGSWNQPKSSGHCRMQMRSATKVLVTKQDSHRPINFRFSVASVVPWELRERLEVSGTCKVFRGMLL